MGKSKNPMRYFSSDFHFNHWNEWVNAEGEKCGRGIISFERTQFKTIQEHDKAIVDMIAKWSKKWAYGSEFWYLGDFGDISYLWVFDMLRDARITVNFMYGNHDNEEDYDLIAAHVDNVYRYPVYLSQKLVVSHFPVAVYEDSVNVCGHLHSAKLADPNHIVASLDVAKWQPISDKMISAAYGQLPKYTRRFLYEPYAADMVFTKPKADVIMDKSGRIDLSASRVMMRLAEKERKANGDPYRPYVGGIE